MSNKVVNIHASCVVLARAGETLGAPADAGILILGESGSGKSDLALRLIDKGALLVADDRCELYIENNRLVARAPRVLAGLVEIRGVGIVRVPNTESACVALAVRCSPGEIQRLPEPRFYDPPQTFGSLPSVPEITLAPFGASATAKVVAAAAHFAQARGLT